MAAALFEGASIGPLIDMAIQIDPRYISLCRFSLWMLDKKVVDFGSKMDGRVLIFANSVSRDFLDGIVLFRLLLYVHSRYELV